MTKLRIRGSVLGASALLLVATAATACTAASANTLPSTAVSGSTSAPNTSKPATTTTTTTSTPSTSTTTHSAVTAASSPTVYTCEGNTIAAPSTLVLACADQKMGLGDLHWSEWGEPTAHATGTFWQYNCIPNCATGKLVSVPTSVTVSGLANGHYGRLHVTATPLPTVPHDYTLSTVGPAAQ